MMRIMRWLAFFLFLGSTANAQTACSTYTVQGGDTLGSISTTAYGGAAFAQLIYDANRAIIGRDRSNLISGVIINVPCADGAISTTDFVTARTVEQPQQPKTTAPTFPFRGPMRIVTNPNLVPFSGHKLPELGIIPELVKESVALADPDREIRFFLLEGMGNNLTGAFDGPQFDLALPVYLPNCSNLEPLNQSDRKLCTGYFASKLLYEVVMGMYVMNDSLLVNARSIDALQGLSICRPEGSVFFDLVQAGLNETQTKFITKPTAADCLEALADRAVDAFSASSIAGGKALSSFDQADSVVEVGRLSTSLSLHAVTPKNNPLGRPYLTIIDNGFRKLLETGGWFSIVSAQIGDFLR